MILNGPALIVLCHCHSEIHIQNSVLGVSGVNVFYSVVGLTARPATQSALQQQKLKLEKGISFPAAKVVISKTC